MILFKLSVTFFILFILLTAVFGFVYNPYVNKERDPAEFAQQERFKYWFVRCGGLSILTFWLSVVGLIWH